MKEILEAPTFGDCRRDGLHALNVHCADMICGHTKRLAFDALHLPDEMVFEDIPRRRRFVCVRCGKRAIAVSPDWTDYVAVGNGKRPIEA